MNAKVRTFLTVLIGSLALLAAGLCPAAESTSVSITVSRPGESATEVDASVATPLARALSQSADVVRVETESTEGRCVANVGFGSKVGEDKRQRVIRQQLVIFAAAAPADCAPPVIAEGRADALPRFWLTLTGDTLSPVELSNIALSRVAERLPLVSGVTEVQTFGVTAPRTMVWLNPKKLSLRVMTTLDVYRALRAAKVGESDDVANLVLRQVDSGTTRVSDVGRVEHRNVISKFAAENGKPVVLITIAVTAGAPVALLEKEIDRLRRQLPRGVTLSAPVDLTRQRCVLIEGTRELAAKVAPFGAGRRCIAVEREAGGKCWYVIVGADVSAADVRRAVEGAEPKVRVCEVGGNAAVPFGARVALAGIDRALLRRWSEAVAKRLSEENVVADLVADADVKTHRLEFQVDRDLLARLGVTEEGLPLLRRLMAGDVETLQEAAHLEMRLQQRTSIGDMAGELWVKSIRDAQIPFSAVATVKEVEAPVTVRRDGSLPATRLDGAAMPGRSNAECRAKMLEIVEAERVRNGIPKGYRAVVETGLPE